MASADITVEAVTTSAINLESAYNIRVITRMPLPVGTSMQVVVPSQLSITAESNAVELTSAIGFSPLSSVISVVVEDLST